MRSLLEVGALSDQEREEYERAWKQYCDSFPDWAGGDGGDDSEDDDAQATTKGAWNFSAAQMTFNGTTGDWASKDEVVLASFFARFKDFCPKCLAPFHPLGISATMERSTVGDEQVHLHAYFHLKELFRGETQDCLSVFEFESVRPHAETNKARGNAYPAAANRGHFYVGIDKIVVISQLLGGSSLFAKRLTCPSK